ncbi:TonB-dependent receptor [Pseudomonas sp. Choline-3u-10]|jgi:TonB-dependent receptor|uniref:TonB-dependent receptor n=1 Tax=Pseudomonadaceae TaxID=135621 RepID=UPI000617B033|nr:MULTISPECIES: TonB-dependent receptor [Pseudomonadaceae]MBU0948977.1 TonB-dependent receptor [Gammaproteobacteria bacterium]HBM08380.1 TonB-dependent receptor [Pseudomonas sp.]KJJ64099.1 TonB-dependent receptor [Pseudomonas sp. 10B238]MBK3796796.1 TonB-dependent receptor [Stutzerimonas stutzeri]MBK3877299.1 TonB-dependent receptor [Stutzerimonas stutzeri]
MSTYRSGIRHAGFRISLLALAVSAGSAWAEEPLVMEHVEVIGQAVSVDEALRDQRNSDSVKSVVHADGIGQLPDDNAAEALQRIPGLSVERDQGEGRFVSVRGIAPDLNSVTINGTLVPSPESGRRAVALDVLPSELVQSLSVVKTLTPDMDANSLGGTIEVESLSAFDHDGLFYSLSTEASYDENVGETSPKFSGAISNRFSLGGGVDNFGVAAALSWQDRDFGSDNVETGGAWDFEDGARLEEFEQRDYEITRERTGFGLNFDYQPDDFSSYYLRTLYSRFKDTETRNAAGVEFEDAQRAGELGDAEGWRELKSREETQTIQSYVFGGERMMGLWTLSGQVGYSEARERNPGGISSATFEGDFADVGFSSTGKPRLTVDPSFYDPASFELDEVEWEKTDARDKEKNIRLDLARDYDIQGYASQLKFGGKLSRRDKTNDAEIWAYDDFDDLTLADFQSGKVDYALDRFGSGISAGGLEGLIGGLDASEFYDQEESRIGDFDMSEDINAAYFMNTLDLYKWRIIAGLRYEGTEFSAKGTGLRDGEFEAVSSDNRYEYWLPGLHARYELTPDTFVRAAWTNTVVRPTFEQLAPGFVIDGEDAEFGNPDLKPLESMNYDLGIEHYMGRAGAVSAYLFYKDIDNFIYNTDLAGTGQWTGFDEALSFENGSSAKLYGVELAYSQKLNWLPAPWNGVLLGANATFSKSDAEIEGQGSSRSIDLPNHSDSVGNLMVGWENDVFNMRLAANYKSEYLAEVAGIDDAAHDLYADDQLFVDFKAGYFITPNLQVTLEALNLTDESYFVYTGRSNFNAQYEEYGPTYKLGLTLTHF